jgi:hypothetical protein
MGRSGSTVTDNGDPPGSAPTVIDTPVYVACIVVKHDIDVGPFKGDKKDG